MVQDHCSSFLLERHHLGKLSDLNFRNVPMAEGPRQSEGGPCCWQVSNLYTHIHTSVHMQDVTLLHSKYRQVKTAGVAHAQPKLKGHNQSW